MGGCPPGQAQPEAPEKLRARAAVRQFFRNIKGHMSTFHDMYNTI